MEICIFCRLSLCTPSLAFTVGFFNIAGRLKLFVSWCYLYHCWEVFATSWFVLFLFIFVFALMLTSNKRKLRSWCVCLLDSCVVRMYCLLFLVPFCVCQRFLFYFLFFCLSFFVDHSSHLGSQLHWSHCVTSLYSIEY